MGKIAVKKQPEPAELDALKVKNWPTWEKEVSEFDWFYPEQEMAYIIEGECIVTPIDDNKALGVPIKFSKGDLVTFPANLSVKWAVLKPLRKHYKLDGNWFSRTLHRMKLKFSHS